MTQVMTGIGQRELFIASVVTAVAGCLVSALFLFAPAENYLMTAPRPLAFFTGGLFAHGFHVLSNLSGLEEDSAKIHRESQRLGLIVEEYEGRIKSLLAFYLILTATNTLTPWIAKTVALPHLLAITSLTLNVVAVFSVFFVHAQGSEIARFKRDLTARRKRKDAQDSARAKIKRH